VSIIIPDEATLAEWIATAYDVCRDELFREPDPAYLASMVHVAATPPPEGGSKEAMIRVTRLSPEWHAKHDRPQLPAIPSRDAVCGVRTHFQGISYDTREFGPFPGAFLALLADDDRAAALALHKALGDTHVTMDLTGAYREPAAIYPERLKNGHDWSNDLPGIKARVREAVVAGLFVDFALGGDGRSVNDNPAFGQYNDPVGDTYGHEWLMANLERIVTAFRGDAGSEAPDGEDLTRYMRSARGTTASSSDGAIRPGSRIDNRRACSTSARDSARSCRTATCRSSTASARFPSARAGGSTARGCRRST